MSALMDATEAFADDGLVLIGGDRTTETIYVACAADRIDASALESLHDVGPGMVVLGLAEEIAERLALPEPRKGGAGQQDINLTVPIDAAAGLSGGWSPRDRALTMRVAADPNSLAGDVLIPGHVYPAVLEERHATSAAAAVELARLTGRAPAVALTAVVDRHGRAASLAEARRDSRLGRLHVASPAELHAGRIARSAVELSVGCTLPTTAGTFRAVCYEPAKGDPTTVSLIHGDPAARERPLVHVHVACLSGDAFGSLLCDCRQTLDHATEAISREGAGVIVYAKPGQAEPTSCTRDQHVDPVLVAGLLRASGIDRLRLVDGKRSARLRNELRRCGLEVAS